MANEFVVTTMMFYMCMLLWLGYKGSSYGAEG